MTALTTYRLFRHLQLDRLIYLMPKRTERQLLRDRIFFRLARRARDGSDASCRCGGGGGRGRFVSGRT